MKDMFWYQWKENGQYVPSNVANLRGCQACVWTESRWELGGLELVVLPSSYPAVAASRNSPITACNTQGHDSPSNRVDEENTNREKKEPASHTHTHKHKHTHEHNVRVERKRNGLLHEQDASKGEPENSKMKDSHSRTNRFSSLDLRYFQKKLFWKTPILNKNDSQKHCTMLTLTMQTKGYLLASVWFLTLGSTPSSK